MLARRGAAMDTSLGRTSAGISVIYARSIDPFTNPDLDWHAAAGVNHYLRRGRTAARRRGAEYSGPRNDAAGHRHAAQATTPGPARRRTLHDLDRRRAAR